MNTLSRIVGAVGLAALATSLTACGGSGTAASIPVTPQNAVAPVAPAAASSEQTTYALGFVPADPITLSQIRSIRYTDSVATLPAAVNLGTKMPAVGNQGTEGSCVAWATAYALRGYEAREDVWARIAPKSTAPNYNFSPAFVYNQLNGGHDGGTTIPAALTLMQTKGAATLADMPYVNGQYQTKPTAAALADALHYKLSSFGYIAPTDLTTIKSRIAAGIPVVLAFQVYKNFFSLGYNAVYKTMSGGLAGGHAVTIVGYDDSKNAVQIINSWGPYWSTGGYGWIDYNTLKTIGVEAYSAIDDHGAPPAPH